jgi:hypothetical protein
MQAVLKPTTYEEWLRIPATNQCYEITDAMLVFATRGLSARRRRGERCCD